MYKSLILMSLALVWACSDDSKFAGGSASDKAPSVPSADVENGSGGAPGDGTTIGGETSLPEKCEAAAGSLKVVEQDIQFPERLGCDFPEGFDEGANQEIVTHAKDQTIDLTVPDGTICAMEIQSESERIRYDDFLIFSIDKHVLLSSNGELVKQLDKSDSTYKWDFAKVEGFKIDDFYADLYCIGKEDEGDCAMPQTEKTGRIRMNLEPKVIAPISKAIEGKKSVPFTLTSTGDNDPSKDCFHTEINLKVKIQYLAN